MTNFTKLLVTNTTAQELHDHCPLKYLLLPNRKSHKHETSGNRKLTHRVITNKNFVHIYFTGNK
jgi:hypothetical protein